MKHKKKQNLMKVLKSFEAFEKKFQLDDQIIDNIHWWDFLRYTIYLDLLIKLKLYENNFVKKNKFFLKKNLFKRFINYINKIRDFIYNIFFSKSPIWIKKNKIIIFGHSRRVYENELYIDKYVDPLIDLFKEKKKFIVIEDPLNSVFFSNYNLLHFKPAKTKNLFYGDILIFFSSLLSKFYSKSISKSEINQIEQFENQFKNLFKVELKLLNKIQNNIPIYKSKLFIYKIFFKIKKPKKIIVVNSIGYEAVIETAKNLGIPTYELQHGSPSRGKLNYDYSSSITKSTFPNYFLSFGKIWTEDVKLPIKKENIIEIGFPYLNQKLRSSSTSSKKKNIFLILSQGNISDKLMKFTLKLRKTLKKEIKIFYKPHPGEIFSNNKDYFKQLEDNNISVLRDYKTDLYGMLKKSRWVLGVSSTALYEALAFNCQVFVLKENTYESLNKLIKRNLVYLIKSSNEVHRLIRNKKKVNVKNLFFNDKNKNIKMIFK